jgi:uncharacterized protein YlxW (UPF0749 family)
MLLGSQNVVFGLSVFEIGALLAAAGYLTSLWRDWRPMKAMRAENKELREDLNTANGKIRDLEVKVEDLEKRTDLTALQKETAAMAAAMARVAKHLDHLDHSVKASTAAVELIAQQSAIGQALDDHDRQ